MLKISLFFPLILAGCALSSQRRPQSQWAVLKETASLACQKWPLPVGALGVQDLRFARRGSVGPPQLCLQLLSRRGQEQFYVAPLPLEPSLDAADFAFRELQPGAGGEEPVVSAGSSQAFAEAEQPVLAEVGLAEAVSESEAWALLPQPGSYLLASVNGDSLAGEAVLHVASYTAPALPAAGKAARPLARRWQQSFALGEAHVGGLRWLAREGLPADKGVQLVFLQWLDAEATLARYQVNEQGAKVLPSVGLFPAGSVLLSSTPVGGGQEAKNSGFYGILRYPWGLGWQFELCHLEGLESTVHPHL